MTYQLTQSEIAALNPPNYDIVKFVEGNRFLGKQAAETGLKRIARTPYLYCLYKWFLDDKVKEIVIQKPAQIGITDWVVDCVLWIACNDPSPTALFLSDQETAKKLMKFRIEPAFRAMNLLRYRSAAQKQDVSKFEINLSNGFYLAVSWGSSISQTASMSFKRVFADEINKPGYDVMKDEGDTLSRIRERMETFGDSKFILLSTPTLDTGRITQEFSDCDLKYDFTLPCPNCGIFQQVKFENIIWEGGGKATREQIESSVRYKCSECGALWTEEQRQVAVSNGKSLCRTEESGQRERIGYQLHRLVSLFKGGNMARMVYSFLRSKDDPGKLQNVVNSTFGEPWIPRLTASHDERQKQIEKCICNLRKLELPENVIGIVAAVDVQNRGFWYRLRAISEDASVYGIDEGYVETWEQLDEIIFEREYSGLKVWRCLIDTGGGRAAESYVSRTEETYIWIRKNAGRGCEIYGTKGSSWSMTTKIKIGSIIERTPSGKPIPGGIRIVQVNTEKVKDALLQRIEQTNESSDRPGNWWIHRDTPEWYFQQVTAEEKRINRKNVVEWVRVRSENHIFDCECLCLIATDPEFYGGIKPLIMQKKRKEEAVRANTVVNSGIYVNPVIRRY